MMNQALPLIIAGPLFRRLTSEQMVLWLVSSQPLKLQVDCYQKTNQELLFSQLITDDNSTRIQVGERAFVYLIDITPPTLLPVNEFLEYDLLIETEKGQQSVTSILPHLLYPGETRLSFVVKTQLDHIIHGSCRKPHYSSEDAFLRVDQALEQHLHDINKWPALLVLTGDQIYADDVGGPMLQAIHQASVLLGLYPETLEGATIPDSEALLKSEFCYYQREEILPRDHASRGVGDMFFGGARKPIFTSVDAHNHLITLAEVLAMYFLIWSPVLWKQFNSQPDKIREENRELYLTEHKDIEGFARGLAQVQRMLAHLPTYMIFDDHDVTDDWNLTRGWEETAYHHPVSRRIIGNTLIGYWLCQGWGNAPQHFDNLFLETVKQCFQESGGGEQDKLIDALFQFDHWNFSLPTTPKMIVLDTRTNRWWSEGQQSQPSGLMDWEALSELQQELMDEPSVVLVSPAPIFGVKLIEAVQRIFSFFGHALIVDAENWMAHSGSANVILNIFKNPRTPQNFVILSGDVHYSLVYDVKIRFRKNSPNIWQITCSGIKNEFPHRLLSCFEFINRWIYNPYSLLNWLTKRRHMFIRPREPKGLEPKQLVNKSAIGWVELNEQGVPQKISILPAEGGEYVFIKPPDRSPS